MEVRNKIPDLNAFDVTRFWLYVDRKGPDDCWEWQGGTRLSNGTTPYGRFKACGVFHGAHRIAYYLQHCMDPGEQIVCHSCDNPLCCNGSHLFTGTHLDNARDRDRKGRGHQSVFPGYRTRPENFARGSRVKGSKLLAEQVREIRRLYATGQYTVVELGKQFGVSHNTICAITAFKTWAHLK
jgi:hypothetical protein